MKPHFNYLASNHVDVKRNTEGVEIPTVIWEETPVGILLIEINMIILLSRKIPTIHMVRSQFNS